MAPVCNEFGVYDEKSLIALNLFGMPQARLGAVATSVPEPQGNAIGDTSETVGQTLITVLEQGATVEESLTLERQSNALGSWFTLEGNAQGVVGRACSLSRNLLNPVLYAPVEQPPMGSHCWVGYTQSTSTRIRCCLCSNTTGCRVSKNRQPA